MADKVYLNEAERIADEREARRNDPNRGNILPFRKTEEGLEWALPQWMEDAINTFTLPRDVLKGYQPTPQETTDFAANVGLGGMGVSGAVTPEADLGMFLGTRSKIAPVRQLDNADIMAQQGKTAEDIWAQTGWFKAPDGNWKFEVSDENMGFTDAGKPAIDELLSPNSKDTALFADTKGLIEHPELQKAYDTDILDPYSSKIEKAERWGGSHTGGKYIDAKGPTAKDLLDTLSHEMQHAVQSKEGFSRGSSLPHVSEIKRDLEDALPKEALDLMLTRDVIESLDNSIRAAKTNAENPQGWGSVGGGTPAPKQSIDELRAELREELQRASDLTHTLKPIMPELEPIFKFMDKDDYTNYRQNAGEVEANATLKRRNLTSEQRKTRMPWEDYDNPAEEQWTEEGIQSMIDNLKTAVKERWKQKASDYGIAAQEAQGVMTEPYFGDNNGR
mgnify:FL=1